MNSHDDETPFVGVVKDNSLAVSQKNDSPRVLNAMSSLIAQIISKLKEPDAQDAALNEMRYDDPMRPMSSTNTMLAEAIESLIRQEVKQEVEKRGMKRSHGNVEPSGPANKEVKTEELDYQESGLPAIGASPVSSSYQDDVVREVKKEEPEMIDDEILEEDLPVKRGRGRPAGVKNKPKEEPKREIIEKFTWGPSIWEKTAFTYPNIVTMALLNFPQQRATVQMIYAFIEYHFPGLPANKHWKSTIRHALSTQYGFRRGDHPSSNGCFWVIRPENKADFMQAILEKIGANKHQMEVFRMRNVDDLPSILRGQCPLPEAARKYTEPSPYAVEERRSSTEYIGTTRNPVQLKSQEERYCPKPYMGYPSSSLGPQPYHQDYRNQYPRTPGTAPYYARPTPHYSYHIPPVGFGMSKYRQSREKLASVGSPSTSSTVFRPYIDVNIGKRPVHTFSGLPRFSQLPIKIPSKFSTSLPLSSEVKTEESND